MDRGGEKERAEQEEKPVVQKRRCQESTREVSLARAAARQRERERAEQEEVPPAQQRGSERERAEQEEAPPREHERSFSLHSHLALHFRCLM